ncbi:hypothetical protein ACFFOP_12660 [Sinosporangium siamense]|uniref:hypothetical protein n=1 Tax=Sinosporangium siamense TaxID=1367973 RepID=UPI0035E7986E
MPELTAAMPDMDVPVKRYDRPIFIAQGAKDEIVQAEVTAGFAEQIKAAGSDVVYKEYPAGHDVPGHSWGDVKVWLKQRFAG